MNAGCGFDCTRTPILKRFVLEYTEQHIAQVIAGHITREFLKDRPDTVVHGKLALIDEGLIDSLGIFTMVGLMEKEFQIKVEPEDVVIANFETVDAMKRLVVDKLSSKR